MKSIEQIKQIAYGLIAISMILIAGFFYVGTIGENNRQTLFFDKMNGADSKQGITQNYGGTMNGNIKIHMHLQISGERIVGYYYYDIFEKILILKGTVDAKGNYHLVEFDENENQTGVFAGQFEPDYSKMTGDWTSKKGNKVLPVDLKIMDDPSKMVDYMYE